MKINTDLLHAHQLRAKLTGDYAPQAMAHVSPIYQTSTYILEDFDSAVYLNQHVDEGFVYTRFGSPNCDELEKKIAHLEHAEAALALEGTAVQLRNSTDVLAADPYSWIKRHRIGL